MRIVAHHDVRQNPRGWFTLLVSAALAITTLSVGGEGVAADGGGQACGSWSIVEAPSPQFAELNDIDGNRADNIWAVGAKNAGGAPLIMHWNGNRWSTVSAPDPANVVSLEGIDVYSRTNAWAVGSYFDGARRRTLILHWNGQRWSRVPSPNPLTGENLLFDVATAGPDKAWAVGGNNLEPTVGNRTIILRWNGGQWVNDHPTAAAGSLASIALRSGTVIAVGRRGANGAPLVERRTASGWVNSSVTTDDLGALRSIDVAAEGPFRAVGSRSGTAALRTFGMHSTPSTWVEDQTPNRGSRVNILHDVSVRPSTSGWAVGYSETTEFVRRTLTMRLASGSWSIVSSPNPSGRDADLRGVYTVPESRVVWAVGSRLDSINASHPLVMRFRC